MTQNKILVVANADSPLLRERVQVTLDSRHEVVWYSESVTRPNAPCRTVHAKKVTGIGPIDKAISVPLFFLTLWKEKPDLVHIHWALFTPLLFKRTWPPVIVSVMGSDVNLPGRFGLRRFFARLALRKANLITSKSAGMDHAILALGDYRDKLRRISWGLDDTWFVSPEDKSTLRRQMHIDDTTTIFFSPRSISPLYRIPDIVRSFAALRDSNPTLSMKLYIAGKLDNKKSSAEVRSLVDKESLEHNVVLLGALDRGAMQRTFAICDAVISYAASDGMPQSLYETMATASFPIFTRLRCYAELLEHERNALLCDTLDPTSLTKQMAKYLTFKGTKREREILQHNTERIREVADKEVQTESLYSMYDHLLANP